MEDGYQMFLVIRGNRHLLKEGITLIGSSESDTYNAIKLTDKSICPKHAAVKSCPATKEVHVMDLCSSSGIVLFTAEKQRQRLTPLEWHKFTTKHKLNIGKLECSLETVETCKSGRRSSASFFADEDSTDFVDCSIEEQSNARSRTVESNQLLSGNTSTIKEQKSSSMSIKDVSLSKEGSFIIPATQQCGSTKKANPVQVNETKVSIREEESDDEDMFYIPETQEQGNDSEIIAPIPNSTGPTDKDDDFLKFDTEDDDNTGDGLFNNPYVLESQNLLKNLDETLRKDADKDGKSVVPDRSVDSISFRGRIPNEETDEELSKIEWNETNISSKPNEIEAKSGSVTPDLIFDQRTTTRNPILDSDREESVTPDLDFDRLTPQPIVLEETSKLSLKKVSSKEKSKQRAPNEEVQDRNGSITPDLNFDNNEEGDVESDAEISLNQEGVPSKQCDQLDPYSLATQAIQCDDPELPDDVYLMPTQKLQVQREPNIKTSTSAYDLPTQLDTELDDEGNSASKCPSTSVYDVLTQKMPQEEIRKACSLRKVAVKLSNIKFVKKNVSMRPNMEITINPFDLQTQPLIPDKDNVYEANTQALPTHELDPLDDTIPLVLPEDAYDAPTQLMVTKTLSGNLEEEDHELSKNFKPRINSTCRQSVLLQQMVGQDKEISAKSNPDLNISPSSNKENSVEMYQEGKGASKKGRPGCETTKKMSNLVEEDLDEEYCLAATIPLEGASNKSDSDTLSKTKKISRTNTKTSANFKVPNISNIASNTKTLVAGIETPRAMGKTRGSDPFNFNTPDHPILKAMKKDTVLAVSDMLKSHSGVSEKLARKNKYIFGDSSDEDHDPHVPVFSKTDSKIQVIKNDKTQTASTSAKSSTFIAERRSNRERKKIDHGDDTSDISSSSSRSGGKKGKDKLDSKIHPKMKVDESVDYQPEADDIPLKRRKRKVDLDDPETRIKSKVSKTSEDEPALKTGSSVEQPVSTRTSRVKREPVINPPTEQPSENNLDKNAHSDEIKNDKRSERLLKRTGSKQKPNVLSIDKPDKDSKKMCPGMEDQQVTKTADSRVKKQPRTREADNDIITEGTKNGPTVDGKKQESRPKLQKKSRKTSNAHTSEDSDGIKTANSSVTSDSESSSSRRSTRAAKPHIMFTKMSPEPYKRMITRAASKRLQNR